MTLAMARTILRLSKAAKASPTLKKLYAKFGGLSKAKTLARNKISASKEKVAGYKRYVQAKEQRTSMKHPAAQHAADQYLRGKLYKGKKKFTYPKK